MNQDLKTMMRYAGLFRVAFACFLGTGLYIAGDALAEAKIGTFPMMLLIPACLLIGIIAGVLGILQILLPSHFKARSFPLRLHSHLVTSPTGLLQAHRLRRVWIVLLLVTVILMAVPAMLEIRERSQREAQGTMHELLGQSMAVPEYSPLLSSDRSGGEMSSTTVAVLQRGAVAVGLLGLLYVITGAIVVEGYLRNGPRTETLPSSLPGGPPSESPREV